MQNLVKGSIGLGICLVSATSVGVAIKYSQKLGVLSETQWESFSGYQTDAPHAYAYGGFLVSADKSENWWQESYEIWQKDTLDSNSKFKIISKGYSIDDQKALNKVCDAAYKSTEWDFSIDTKTTNSNKFDWKDIFKYCSPLRGLPIGISNNDSYENNAIAKTPNNSYFLVDVNGNDKFWQIRDEIFREYAFDSLKDPDIFFQTKRD